MRARPVAPPRDVRELRRLRAREAHAATEEAERRRQAVDAFRTLPPTTRRVALLAAAGLSAPQVAERLGYEWWTVRRHLSGLRRAADARTTLEALVHFGVLLRNPALRAEWEELDP